MGGYDSRHIRPRDLLLPSVIPAQPVAYSLAPEAG